MPTNAVETPQKDTLIWLSGSMELSLSSSEPRLYKLYWQPSMSAVKSLLGSGDDCHCSPLDTAERFLHFNN